MACKYIIVLWYNTKFNLWGVMTRKKLANGLTQQQEDFCKLYVKYGISRKAFIEAYPSAKNWKENSIDSKASQMLNKVQIKQRIDELNEQATSVLMESTKLNKRKLLETALQMLEDTNNPAERTHAVSLIKMLFQKEGMLQPNTAVQVNIQNNTTVNEVTDYLDL